MFIAHLPAGYLLARGLGRAGVPRTRLWTAVALVGSVFPDFDLIYFYLIDNREHLHHSYWTHKPFYWLLILVFALFVAVMANSRSMKLFCAWFFPGVFLHLILDTWVGHVRWISPLSERSFALFEVPAVPGQWWVWNFVLHWTFAVEVAVGIAAVVLLVKGATGFNSTSARRRNRRSDRGRTRSGASPPEPA